MDGGRMSALGPSPFLFIPWAPDLWDDLCSSPCPHTFLSSWPFCKSPHRHPELWVTNLVTSQSNHGCYWPILFPKHPVCPCGTEHGPLCCDLPFSSWLWTTFAYGKRQMVSSSHNRDSKNKWLDIEQNSMFPSPWAVWVSSDLQDYWLIDLSEL